MSFTSPAVQQAVDLLLGRRSALADHVADVNAEIKQIDAALTVLGATGSLAGVDVIAAVSNGETTYAEGKSKVGSGTSVRQAVRDLMNRTPRSLTNDLVQDEIAALFPERTADQLRSNIRSTLYQLVQSGELVKQGRGEHIAAKWLSKNAESPTVDAVGLSVPVPAEQEGGGASGTDTHRVRDDPSSWQAEHLDHDLGAPVVGA